jgi:hypothetical protein
MGEWREDPSKGYRPHNKAYKMMPMDHISKGGPVNASVEKISGARTERVPPESPCGWVV